MSLRRSSAFILRAVRRRRHRRRASASVRGAKLVRPRPYGGWMSARSVHVCSECGHESAGWLGRCPGCGEWNTLVEERAAPASGSGHAGGGGSRRGAKAARPVPLADVEAPPVARLMTGLTELDRVLGGGIVPGSLVLLGGSPGIGKSTITASALGRLAARGHSVLYVSGEESAVQVRLRAERLGQDAL